MDDPAILSPPTGVTESCVGDVLYTVYGKVHLWVRDVRNRQKRPLQTSRKGPLGSTRVDRVPPAVEKERRSSVGRLVGQCDGSSHWHGLRFGVVSPRSVYPSCPGPVLRPSPAHHDARPVPDTCHSTPTSGPTCKRVWWVVEYRPTSQSSVTRSGLAPRKVERTPSPRRVTRTTCPTPPRNSQSYTGNPKKIMSV